MYGHADPPDHRAGVATAKKQVPDLVSRLNTVLHAAIICVALSIAFLLFDSSLFAWHPVFMSVGYIIFMTEGVMCAIMFRHLDGSERVKAIQSHAMLQLRAAVCVAVGFGVIFRNKIIHGKPHFQSLHAKFGLATLILSFLLPIGGALSFRKLGFIQKFPEKLQPKIKALHRQAGTLTWLLSLVTIELALPHKAVNKGLVTTFWQFGIALVGMLVLLLSLKAVAKPRVVQDDPLAKSV